MSIDSVEALEAIPVGATIRVTGGRVGTKDFTRTEKGFKFGDIEVEAKWFAGHVKAGQVQDWTRGDPEPGDHFQIRSRHYVVLSVENGEVVLACTNSRGEFRETSTVPLADCRTYNWTRLAPGDHPAWHQTMFDMATRLLQAQVAANESRRLFRDAEQKGNQVTLDLAERKALRAAQVHVVVDGTTRLSDEVAVGALPKGVTVTNVVAIWRREYTVTTEPATGCQCAVVTRSMVAATLGLDETAEFKFVVDCGRH